MTSPGTLYARVGELVRKAGMPPLPDPETWEDFKAVPSILSAHLLYQVFLALQVNNELLARLVEHFDGEELVDLDNPPGEGE